MSQLQTQNLYINNSQTFQKLVKSCFGCASSSHFKMSVREQIGIRLCTRRLCSIHHFTTQYSWIGRNRKPNRWTSLRWMVIPNYHATNTGHHLL